ncbi:MAG: HAD family hydrolase [Ginsengibacter sp.]
MNLYQKKTEHEQKITAIFIDIGGVLLTDGWNRQCRKNAASTFELDIDDLEERHHLTFDTYEEGKLSLDEYLKRIVFYKDRSFTMDEFKEFMFAQSKAHPEMIKSISLLKEKYGLKVAVISNEGRELTEFRIKKFELNKFVDFFISSSFVHLRKPDIDIFRMALDIAQVEEKDVVYIEDRPMFVQVAEGLGIHGIQRIDHNSTMEKLKLFGLQLEED